tara:strand:+ start:99 stop:614 length:516 start_codon:yes stop_codon:yes gene_type:complete
MSKHFDPKTEFTQGCLNDAGVRIFPSIDNLSKKFAVSRSSLFKKCQKEGWHSERLQFQKQLAAELSKQAIASSINKAETIDTSILRIAARGLQLVEEKLNNAGMTLSPTELKHLLGSATEAQRLTQEVTVHLDTFADDIIDEEAEKSFREVMALLDEAAAIKSAKANHISQ